MYAFYISNRNTGEKDVIFGYRWWEAFEKYGKDPDEWDIDVTDYE